MAQFRIPVGDWSDDGHGKCEWFTVESSQPVQAWREGYFKAKKAHPDLAPDGPELEQAVPTDWPRDRIKEIVGFEDLHDDCNDSETVARYVIAFCKLGDPSLDGSIVPAPEMLPFFGYDEHKRHIGHIGYELWM